MCLCCVCLVFTYDFMGLCVSNVVVVVRVRCTLPLQTKRTTDRGVSLLVQCVHASIVIHVHASIVFCMPFNTHYFFLERPEPTSSPPAQRSAPAPTPTKPATSAAPAAPAAPPPASANPLGKGNPNPPKVRFVVFAHDFRSFLSGN